jgi:hypothetical protein
MTKKIRLIDEETTTEASAADSTSTGLDNEQVMKYLEAIDWKLWEILKLARKVTGEQ